MCEVNLVKVQCVIVKLLTISLHKSYKYAKARTLVQSGRTLVFRKTCL